MEGVYLYTWVAWLKHSWGMAKALMGHGQNTHGVWMKYSWGMDEVLMVYG